MIRHCGAWVVLLAPWLLVSALSGRCAEPGAKDDEKRPAKAAVLDLYQDGIPDGALARLGTVRFRHDSTAIAYSSDGKLLASGGRDNTIRLFDAATGKEIRRGIGPGFRSKVWAKGAGSSAVNSWVWLRALSHLRRELGQGRDVS